MGPWASLYKILVHRNLYGVPLSGGAQGEKLYKFLGLSGAGPHSGPRPMQPAILIVDDVPANLMALDAALEPLGVATVRAASGEEAVRLTASQEFAAVLMDVRMPGMDGVEAATVIRRRPQGRELPIVLLSAIDKDLMHVERGYQAGAIDYLLKPLDELALRAKVAVLVELWQARQLERLERDRRIHELEGNEVRYRDLLSWFGHELRNPLAALWTVLELRRRRGPGLAPWEQVVVRQVEALRALADKMTQLEREEDPQG
jgi:CheY-like chemotaxis protein